MLRFDLPAAATTLGRNAETILGKLEAAGLVVVRRTDLPELPSMVSTVDARTSETMPTWSLCWSPSQSKKIRSPGAGSHALRFAYRPM